MRSDRGIGLVLMVVFVLSPLTFFATSALLPEERSPDLLLSVDGVSWSTELQAPIMASEAAWWPSEERSAIVYVRNAEATAREVRLMVVASPESPFAPHPAVEVMAGPDRTVVSPVSGPAPVGLVPARSSIPVVITARFTGERPAVEMLDSDAVQFTVDAQGAPAPIRTMLSDRDNGGARLWLAPLLFVVVLSATAVLARGNSRGGAP